jgi:hypothetical protein
MLVVSAENNGGGMKRNQQTAPKEREERFVSLLAALEYLP